MPKASRTARHGAHISSAKLNKPTADLPSFDFSKSKVIPSAAEGTSEEAQESHIVKQQSKKEKQIGKRQLFLQKLGPNPQTLSKSSSRRLKRKTKEQLSGGLDDLQSAIATLEKETANQDEGLTTIGDAKEESTAKPTVKPGTIGKSASSTLSKAQRKRILEIERLRHPLILTNSEFSSNPFQTIRTHAQNTLLKHDSQA